MEIIQTNLVIFTVILFVLLLIIELYFPEREYENNLKKRSYLVNGLVFGLNNVVLFLFNVSAVAVVASNYRLHSWFELLPVWAQVIVGILLLDLFIWFWHLINHKVGFLWCFHKCHHSEKYLNVTSAIRFHLGELLLSVVAKAVFMVLVGVPLWIFILYESLVTIFAAFHHSNLYLPKKLQLVLEKIIITPDLHRTHHSTIRVEHDNNYGVIFSWWDTIFGTRSKIQPEEIGLSDVEEKDLFKFLKFPFRK